MALPQQEMLKEYRDRLQALARGADQGGGTAAGNQGTKDAAGEKIQVTPYVWGSGPAPTFPKAAAASAQAAQPVAQAGQGVSAGEAGMVSQARDYLQGVISGGSGGYRSDYTGQIADLYDQIMNRPKFSYDPNQDPLYSAYRDQYMQNGQLAMRDAMGTAAGLTGGCGNSWGDTAGFQAYLEQMKDNLPEPERTAPEGYPDDEELPMTSGELEADGYSRYVNELSAWMNSGAAKQNAGEADRRKASAAMENLPDSPRGGIGDAKSGNQASLLPIATETFSVQVQTLLNQLEALSTNAFQGKKGRKRRRQVQALHDLAKEMAKSEEEGRVDSKLGWAVLRAAMDMLENLKA